MSISSPHSKLGMSQSAPPDDDEEEEAAAGHEAPPVLSSRERMAACQSVEKAA